jgi:2-keto-4-pentenoate hydratase/2-oxohepta-3-ene-1,7-dioic acid hydratase in catechol pathway
MIFKSQILVDHIKEHFPVCPGDLILTGTPAGVGPLSDGDLVRAEIPGEISHSWRVRKTKKRDASIASEPS